HAALLRVSIRAVRPEMWQRYHTLGERWRRRFRDAASRLLNHLSTPRREPLVARGLGGGGLALGTDAVGQRAAEGALGGGAGHVTREAVARGPRGLPRSLDGIRVALAPHVRECGADDGGR